MNQKTKIECVKNEQQILKIMQHCSSDFFDQSFNDDKKIKELAGKFFNYGHFLVAMLNEEVVGFIAFYSNDTSTRIGFLSMIIVRENYQGNGIGSDLMKACINYCILEGMNELHLEVNQKNIKAIAMYYKIGFSIIECKPDTYILGKKIGD